MTHLKRKNYFVKIEITQTRPYNTIRSAWHFGIGLICKVVLILCFFYLNKVIFAVLDVSSLPLQKCQNFYGSFFHINYHKIASVLCNNCDKVSVYKYIRSLHSLVVGTVVVVVVVVVVVATHAIQTTTAHQNILDYESSCQEFRFLNCP